MVKKWYVRLFYHLIDLSLINAWLLNKQLKPGINIKQQKFRIQCTQCLYLVEDRSNKHELPSHIQVERQLHRKKYRDPENHVYPKDDRRNEQWHT